MYSLRAGAAAPRERTLNLPSRTNVIHHVSGTANAALLGEAIGAPSGGSRRPEYPSVPQGGSAPTVSPHESRRREFAEAASEDAPGSMTDQELMAALRIGDDEAMRSLVERYGRRLFRYLRSLANSHEDAMDLTQEVLVRIYEKAGLYDGRAPLIPWIFRIARNLFHDHLRKRNFKVHSAATELDDRDALSADAREIFDPERRAFNRQIAARVRSAIEILPTRQREVVQLRLLGEMRLEEIADLLGLSIGGVKSTLHNAIARLRAELSDLEGLSHV